jgi:iron complex transport system permease protein
LLPASAFLFAAMAALLIHLLAKTQANGADSVVLFGIALVFAINSLVALLQFMADADTLQQIVFWGTGSLGAVNLAKDRDRRGHLVRGHSPVLSKCLETHRSSHR